ncbi:hypothetical protein [Paenibacillus sp. NPDC058177]|uniref:hypothetical protein n=1 Tax=Paenibacillus sp. NPDC058177 TaxID=3346369 RepID=UPI0036D83BF3
MVDKVKKVSNPLTIIAIFAGLAEVSSTVALGLLEPSLQKIFIWFVMVFPSVLVVLFFLILCFRSDALYAPSDFKDEKNFLIYRGSFVTTEVIESKEDNGEIEKPEETKSNEASKTSTATKVETVEKALNESEYQRAVAKLSKAENIIFNNILQDRTRSVKDLVAITNIEYDRTVQVIKRLAQLRLIPQWLLRNLVEE